MNDSHWDPLSEMTTLRERLDRILNEAFPERIQAKGFLAQFKYITRDEEHFALIPESQPIRLLFYLGGPGILPRMDDSEPLSAFCKKVLSLLF